MFARILFFTALLVVPLAYFLSHQTSIEHAPYVQGRNKTVLFLTNSEHGLSNVHLATASAILENYPDIEVHFASFPAIEQKLEWVSSFAKIKTPHARTIAFHGLTGLTFVQAIAKEGRSFISPPGWRGIATLAEHMQLWISPWTFEDHLHLYEELGSIIDKVDPAVIVLDNWFRPAIDATRTRNRQHAFITPNTLVDHFLGIQPFWTRLWKYPAFFRQTSPVLGRLFCRDQQLINKILKFQVGSKKAPTVLINLGSNLAYDESRAEVMANDIAALLSSTENQCIMAVRTAIIKTLSGVTQVILPLWADLYNYAALAETRGVGVWGCKESTPNWTTFFAIVASALPDPKGHEFRAAGPYDSRSPCPGLNALANHGYLPRDGANINYDMINHAAQAAYNFEDGFYIDAVNMVFQLNISTSNRPSETFHLRDLAQHDQIEVDGSLTRSDIFFGDDLHFDATVFDPVSRDLGLDKISRKDKFVTIETAAKATKTRLDLAKRVNPEFNASVHQHQTEYGTTALYLLTVWDEQHKAAPKHWVKALLGEDRIAYREGYNKGKSVKTNKQVGAMTQAVRAVVDWKH
ncbi:sterigmatocystin biosynthesis peroxidase stcC [Fusarium agapanthi]|uniref:Sterigmatocystin biosynthesis peroxidase stcC n=1 Tax=Fusarium agapanthi TaxID=1803897 RepID=A0A9P5ECA6_9HYPO|nr:sterigmatocystin biosynthesis peroxidase stcC [Fusarium agapanthi]